MNESKDLGVGIFDSKKPASLARTPPRPPLLLRVGVTGHRLTPEHTRTEEQIKQIRDAIREVLAQVVNAFDDVAKSHVEMFSIAEKQGPIFRDRLRIISSLASGADQWVAEEAIAIGYELQAPLPVDRDRYRLDFAGDPAGEKKCFDLLVHASAVLELDGKLHHNGNEQPKIDPQSFVAVGEAMLDQTDLLLAVWDGKHTQEPGGTCDIVRRALLRGIPVVWIHWNEAGRWETRQPSGSARQNHIGASDAPTALKQVVEDLLLPPESFESLLEGPRHDLRTKYARERQPCGNPLLGWWLLFRDSLCGEVFENWRRWLTLDYFRVASFAGSDGKSTSAGALPNAAVTQIHELQTRFQNPYAWADGLSQYYGTMYRSSFVMTFLLGAAAVFFAVLGVAIGGEASGHAETGGHSIGYFAELTLIVTILLIIIGGRRQLLHERWIDYRTLAERLRLAQFLSFWGGGGQELPTSPHLATYGNPAATWMRWYYREFERSAGLPNVKFDEPYLQACRQLWREKLLQEQIDYHRTTHHRFHKLEHRLHRIGLFLFWATLAVCLTHIVLTYLEVELPGEWLVLLAAFLPALGAALAGIRSQGEFQRVARRCLAMEARLKEYQQELDRLPTREHELDSVRLRDLSRRVAQTMANEMLDWRVVFQDRPLALP